MTADQARLVCALRDSLAKLDAEHDVALIETHISYVLLTGMFAYKIKKAVDLGFLDFRTLDARHFYCGEELRLNRRFAPQIYLDVVPITGSIEAPVLGGTGSALEYAVKMHEFAQEALASRELARNGLSPRDIDALAATIAQFHASAAIAPPDSALGLPEHALRMANDNFAAIESVPEAADDFAALERLAAWTKREYASCAERMALRRTAGRVRECHGDLHLGNIARIDGTLTLFDSIEFNERMRWIDVMSEVAFTTMDLADRGRPDYAHRFLNAYLEITGDYAGLSVLRFHVVYRAMVRGKIAVLRAAQLVSNEAKREALTEYRGYLNLAARYVLPPPPAIVITHGLAGSGKTTMSQPLLERLGAVRIRTDVERKRAHGLLATARNAVDIDAGLYAPELSRQTYLEIVDLVRQATACGYPVIVDGAFLKRSQRQLFRALAAELRIAFAIVSFSAPEAILRERVERRMQEGKDASDADVAVLEHQLRTQEPLGADELSDVFAYGAPAADDTPSTPDWRSLDLHLQRAQ